MTGELECLNNGAFWTPPPFSYEIQAGSQGNPTFLCNDNPGSSRSPTTPLVEDVSNGKDATHGAAL